jgi:diketogulonate reductase-like aldo/keto reductase
MSRTSDPGRVSENLAVFDFELGKDEMAAMQALARPIADTPGRNYSFSFRRACIFRLSAIAK